MSITTTVSTATSVSPYVFTAAAVSTTKARVSEKGSSATHIGDTVDCSDDERCSGNKPLRLLQLSPAPSSPLLQPVTLALSTVITTEATVLGMEAMVSAMGLVVATGANRRRQQCGDSERGACLHEGRSWTGLPGEDVTSADARSSKLAFRGAASSPDALIAATNYLARGAFGDCAALPTAAFSVISPLGGTGIVKQRYKEPALSMECHWQQRQRTEQLTEITV
ncbi:hypothetical protein MRX96_001477 [Rhipicephalus microplus]